MKRFLVTAMIWGWFFGLQFEYSDVPGAQIVSMFGPFKTEMECKTYLAHVTDYLDSTKLTYQRSECTYVQES